MSIAAHAGDFPAFTPIPVGYISYDVTGADVAQFDIVNFTGGNSSIFPDMTFPISTPLSLTNLSLTVNYLGGRIAWSWAPRTSPWTPTDSPSTENSSRLSLVAPTGLFDATSAILTGVFSTQNLTLNDGSTEPGVL